MHEGMSETPQPHLPESAGSLLVPHGEPAPGLPPVALQAPVVPVPTAKSSLADWLFGAWVTGGSRPISKSWSFRWSVIAAIIAGGSWAYSSTIADAPGWLSGAAPVVTRLCLSFAAAFLVGFVVRKMLKAVFIVGLLLAVLFFGAKLLGIKIDLSAIKDTTEQAVEGTRSLAQRLGEAAKHYLPSTFAASIGLWRGGTRDSIK